ncbi:unnamed protein product [Lota lota]
MVEPVAVETIQADVQPSASPGRDELVGHLGLGSVSSTLPSSCLLLRAAVSVQRARGVRLGRSEDVAPTGTPRLQNGPDGRRTNPGRHVVATDLLWDDLSRPS